MQHVSEILPSVLNRLKCVSELRDGTAMSALETAIDTIRDDLERWTAGYEPEELEFTRALLGSLIDLQVKSVEQAIRLGEAMNRRKLENPDNDDDPLPPASMARAA